MKKNRTITLSSQIKKLVTTILVPMIILMLTLLGLFIFYYYTSSKMTHNITDASRFSQSFKDSVDQKMYYYVTDSEYNSGIPTEEIDFALGLAENLIGNTENRDSLKAINSVSSLCENLKLRIRDIESTSGYIEKMQQLESNVYVITELIQNYMSTYLYYEAAELAKIQNRIDIIMIVLIIVSVVMTILVAILTVGQSRRITRSIIGPIDQLYFRVKSIGEGDLIPREPVQANDEKLKTLSRGFEEMVERLVELIELNKKEVERIEKMELSLLQAQINPHFLYNTLETIIWLVETGKNEQAVDMVSSLSNFFRASLSKGRDVITIREEEIHARSYLEIQQVRYRDILNYSIDIDSELKEYVIPKLSLQPLIENALYHGIKLKRGGGEIKVSGYISEGNMCLEVKDTGIGMNEESRRELLKNLKADAHKGFGMAAVYKRLKLMYGEDCEMTIDSKDGIGTDITIIISLLALEKQNASMKEAEE